MISVLGPQHSRPTLIDQQPCVKELVVVVMTGMSPRETDLIKWAIILGH